MAYQDNPEPSEAEYRGKSAGSETRANPELVTEQDTSNSSAFAVGMIIISALAAFLAVEYTSAVTNVGNAINGTGTDPGFTVPSQSVVSRIVTK